MDFIDAIKAHLRGEDSDWVEQSVKIAREIATRSTPDGSDDVDELEDAVLAQLTDPQVLYTVVLARNSTEGEELLAQAIMSAESARSVQVPDPDHDHLEYRGEVRTRRDWRRRGVRTSGLPLVTAGYSLDDVAFEPANIHASIRRAYELPTPLSAVPEVFRLDNIDPALYAAIIAHPELLKSLDWRTFEKLLADVLENFGYEIELQRGSKDGGIDLFAVKRAGILGPERYILQAKRWTNPVGVDPVRQLLFLQSHHRATKACLATTARFTAGAWQLAEQYQWQLSLQDFSGLTKWITAAARQRHP